MNKIWTVLSCLFLLSLLAGGAEASITKKARATVTAGAYFVARDTIAPSISHTPITHIARYNGAIFVAGTAYDNEAVRAVLVYYKFEGLDISTKTYLLINGSKRRADAYMTSYAVNCDLSSYLSSLTDDINYFYYAVVTIDNSGNYAIWNENGAPYTGIYPQRQSFPGVTEQQMKKVPIGSRVVKKFGGEGGEISLDCGNPNEGNISVTIPAGALSSEVTITIDELNHNQSRFAPSSPRLLSDRPVSMCEFGPEGLLFRKPVAMTLRYADANNDGLVDGTRIRAEYLKVMWWDGYEWRYIGGKIDPTLKTVSAMTTHFSLYALFPSNGLEDDDYRPKERIITPATVDGHNDFAIFGPMDSTDVINIFDITGRKIKKLEEGMNIWDGKDESGNVVQSGLYVFQIKKQDRIISGTIVVAK